MFIGFRELSWLHLFCCFKACLEKYWLTRKVFLRSTLGMWELVLSVCSSETFTWGKMCICWHLPQEEMWQVLLTASNLQPHGLSGWVLLVTTFFRVWIFKFWLFANEPWDTISKGFADGNISFWIAREGNLGTKHLKRQLSIQSTWRSAVGVLRMQPTCMQQGAWQDMGTSPLVLRENSCV